MKILHVFTIPSTPKAFFDGQFRFLSDNGHNVHMASAPGDVDDFCLRNNVTFHPVELARRIDPIADFKSIIELRSLIRREKIDVVVGHTPKGAMTAMAAAWLAGKSHRIYYRHGYIHTTSSGIKGLVLKTVERFTSLLASKIINVSRSIGRLAVAQNLNPNRKQIVIGEGTCGGIDTQNLFNPALISETFRLNLRNSLGIGKDDFVVGFCGRICKEKGIRELIDGFNIFREDNPDVNPKLLLVGEYDQRDILPQDYKDTIKTDPTIISTGLIDRHKLPAYYSLMDLFVFPSYREGFGMCVIEAGAMEVPALVSRSHGCEDSIIDNLTGRYVDISARDIAKKTTDLKDPQLRKRLGRQARIHISSHYDQSTLWPKILNFYNSLK